MIEMITGAALFMLGFVFGCLFLVLVANARRSDRDG